ncbi:MAG TPA: L-threonylcarbamoyladenylate synthase [Candidatus Desulfovibrio intestinipullorum]|uniref:L-threonylcarbamoyladenylate synthase n=1 Tax=Candidatus Desulfovibrio intestinipullorum TaxID=2838536 RepID=A0A9D1PYJ6_9BACT|nr:L-threonylcarbamoyladenylate synthase [Candidatus Desulfovibrio intestinipullorum]
MISSSEQATALLKAVRLLEQGSCLIYPTETFFGLGCDARNAEAVAQIYQAKGRTATKPLPLIAASTAMVAELCDMRAVPDSLLRLWPRPLTLVLPAKVPFPKPLLDSRGCVAIRVSTHPVAAALSAHVGPLTATSANRQGMPPARFAQDLDPLLTKELPVLDLPPEPCGGRASTIISFPGQGRVRLHREGPVTRDLLEKLGLCLE